MATQSLFIDYVKKWFPAITVEVVSTQNDSKRQPSYLHKQMLTPEYSVSGDWKTIFEDNSLIMADVVDYDSPLLPKDRPSMGGAQGEIPKIGLRFQLNEKQLTEIDTMIALGIPEAQIVAKLFRDTRRAIGGIDERNERMFLEAISDGVTVADTDTAGIGVRIDYGIPPTHKRGVAALWTAPTVKALDDIQALLDVVSDNGDVITTVLYDGDAETALLSNAQVKDQFAFASGFTGTNIPNLTKNALNAFLAGNYGVEAIKVDRTVKYQIDKTVTNLKPFKAGRMVFLTDKNVGSLVWSRLAEMNHPVNGVDYQTANGYTLVSKYRVEDPSLSEHTKGQARVLPVIKANGIYILDTKTVQA